MTQVFDLVKLADKLAEAQLTYLMENTDGNADQLREATFAYRKARSEFVVRDSALKNAKSLDDVTVEVTARLSGLKPHLPLTEQEVELALMAIKYTYEALQ